MAEEGNGGQMGEERIGWGEGIRTPGNGIKGQTGGHSTGVLDGKGSQRVALRGRGNQPRHRWAQRTQQRADTQGK